MAPNNNMRKLALVLTFSALGGLAVFAPKGSILAQEVLPLAEPSQSASSTKIELPMSPLDPLINEWLKEGKLQKEAQKLMNNIQNKAEEGLEGATDQVKKATQDEISRQIDKEINDTKQGIQRYVQGAVGEIKKVAANLIENIKIFFKNLF